MRRFTLPLVLAFAGFGGAALAQPSDSWFALGEEQASSVQSDSVAPRDPWPAPAARPFELAPTQISSDDAARRVAGPERFETQNELVLDPWSKAERSSALPSAERSARTRVAAAPWAKRVLEVVEPWERMPKWAEPSGLKLVVDPWAR